MPHHIKPPWTVQDCLQSAARSQIVEAPRRTRAPGSEMKWCSQMPVHKRRKIKRERERDLNQDTMTNG